MVRFTSTERAKQGEEEGTAKFARGNRLTMSEQIRCYREECQRIFDLQNRVLSNAELLSSDEEVSSDEDEDDLTAPTGTSSSSGGTTGVVCPSIGSSTGSIGMGSSTGLAAIMAGNRQAGQQPKHRQEESDREHLTKSLEFGVSIPSLRVIVRLFLRTMYLI
ncbi:unnamed protein product [Protopolystoma xenopodis]|uniref:Uncharacterized protein n=1 Tax=Protopolystoma xenopodis TaxID=117903 RepID=A0A3S5BV11_9PLAT|nr:unnamed protein product [Protopolystoma xenopodis]